MSAYSSKPGGHGKASWPRFSTRLVISMLAISAIIAWLVVFDETTLQLLRSSE